MSKCWIFVNRFKLFSKEIKNVIGDLTKNYWVPSFSENIFTGLIELSNRMCVEKTFESAISFVRMALF